MRPSSSRLSSRSCLFLPPFLFILFQQSIFLSERHRLFPHTLLLSFLLLIYLIHNIAAPSPSSFLPLMLRLYLQHRFLTILFSPFLPLHTRTHLTTSGVRPLLLEVLLITPGKLPRKYSCHGLSTTAPVGTLVLMVMSAQLMNVS